MRKGSRWIGLTAVVVARAAVGGWEVVAGVGRLSGLGLNGPDAGRVPARSGNTQAAWEPMPASVGTVGFGRIRIGWDVADWFPVDADSDGVWELAVTVTAGTTRNVGVFNPNTGQWMDGPRVVIGGLQEWGVDDYDADGFLEYAYRRADTIRMLDPNGGTDDALWVIPFTSIGQVVFWGKAVDGNGCVGITEPIDSSRTTVYADSTVNERWISWTLHVYKVMSGLVVATISGGPSPWQYIYGFPEADSTALGVHAQRYYSRTGPTNHSTRFEGVSLYRRDWALRDSLVISSGGIGWEPFADRSLECFALGWPLDSSAVYVLTKFEGLFATQVRVRDLDSTIGNWQLACTWNGAYAGAVGFDLPETGLTRWLLPLSGSGWERRELATGVIVDTMKGMPSVDLHSGALFAVERANMFYVKDSSLYVWISDVYSDIGGGESGPLPDAELALRAAPNPFNSAVSFSWSNAVEPSRLEVFNILGQRVREFDLSAADAVSAIVWDGTNAAGRSVPSGVYFAQLVDRHRSATVKIVLLK